MGAGHATTWHLFPVMGGAATALPQPLPWGGENGAIPWGGENGAVWLACPSVSLAERDREDHTQPLNQRGLDAPRASCRRHSVLPRRVADNLAFDDRADAVSRVLERIPVVERDVAVFADLDRPDAIVDPQDARGVDRDRRQRLVDR